MLRISAGCRPRLRRFAVNVRLKEYDEIPYKTKSTDSFLTRVSGNLTKVKMNQAYTLWYKCKAINQNLYIVTPKLKRKRHCLRFYSQAVSLLILLLFFVSVFFPEAVVKHHILFGSLSSSVDQRGAYSCVFHYSVHNMLCLMRKRYTVGV